MCETTKSLCNPRDLQIIFIDEIDAIAPSRGGPSGNSSAVSARLVTTLLTELDSVKGTLSAYSMFHATADLI